MKALHRRQHLFPASLCPADSRCALQTEVAARVTVVQLTEPRQLSMDLDRVTAVTKVKTCEEGSDRRADGSRSLTWK